MEFQGGAQHGVLLWIKENKSVVNEDGLTWGPKSQREGKVPTFEPQEIIKAWLVFIKVVS